MSGQASGWVWRNGPTLETLDRNGKPYGTRARGMRTVLSLIADAANTEGERSYPGLAFLTEASLYSRSSVKRFIRELETEGWVEVVAFRDGGRGHATEFRIPGVAAGPGWVRQPLTGSGREEAVNGTGLAEVPGCERGSTQTPLTAQRGPNESERGSNPSQRGPNESERGSSGWTPNGLYNGLYNGKHATSTGETSSPDVLKPDEIISAPLMLVSETETIDEVQTVFDTWRRATGKLRARLDAKRRKRIQDALKNYSLDDVLAAVQGWQHSRFHRGENENAKVYNDLDLLLRDASKIEAFRDLWFAGPQETVAKPLSRQEQITEHNRQVLAAALAKGREVG